MKNFLFFCPMLAVSFLTANAKVTPGSMITDNMVLQQNGKARLYGTADPNKTVTVTPSWNNAPYQTKSDSNGKWNISIDTPAGGYTPYSITISDGTPVTLNNI